MLPVYTFLLKKYYTISFSSYSYIPFIVEKQLFWSHIFEVEVLMDLHVLRCPESENHSFRGLSVRMDVCICYQHNSKANYRRIFKFGTLHLCHRYMLLEIFFYKDRTKTLCTGVHKRILIH